MSVRLLGFSLPIFLLAACAGPVVSVQNSDSALTSRNPPLTGPFAAPRNCPPNYVGVAGNESNTKNSNDKGIRGFCVSKFEMKHPADVNGRFIVDDNWTGAWNWRPDLTSVPEAKPESRPWILISYQEALDACSRIKSPDFTYSLLSSGEWDVIVSDISRTAENWSLGAVDAGELSRGFRILDVNNRDEATYIRNKVCAWKADPKGFCPAPLPVSQIWNAHSDLTSSLGNSEAEHFIQKRTHLLSNGQTLWDFGGNVSEWVIRPSEQQNAFARGGNFSDVSSSIFTKTEVVALPDEAARKMRSSEARQTFVGFRCVAHPER